MNLQIVILAAGQGKRMYSKTPKVLHKLAGKSLLLRVVEVAEQLNPQGIHVIYGHEGEQIKAALASMDLQWVEQKEQLGTGHAVLQALPYIKAEDYILILSADVPLIQLNTLQELIACCNEESALALLVAHLEQPAGLGRIIRDEEQQVRSIVEEKDATEKQRSIKEIYTGICCVKASYLQRWLPQLKNTNAQSEYYLTDIIATAVQDEVPIKTLKVKDYIEVQGVNNKFQLQQLERAWQQRLAQQFLEQGVLISDAARFDVRGELICGKDVFIDINCTFTGQVVLGDECSIGPNCHLTNVTLKAGCSIEANSVLEDCIIEEHCQIGPFARLRTGTQLAPHCKIGNFVETKKAVFGPNSKANHLSYLGDVQLGKEVNIGAGTITCNYDGANKHLTIIEDGAFIGSDTQLVAPVRVGANATVGAGSTIRKDVPPNELTLSLSQQKTLLGWKRPVKIKKE